MRSATSSAGVQALPVWTFTRRPSGSMTAVRRLCVMSMALCRVVLDVDAELRREVADLGRLAGEERPDRRIGAAPRRVRLQHRRRVERRIERHRDQPHVGQRRRARDRLLHRGEVPVHQRTEVGQRAARVDERERHAGGPANAESDGAACRPDRRASRRSPVRPADRMSGASAAARRRVERARVRSSSASTGARPLRRRRASPVTRSPGSLPVQQRAVLHLERHRHAGHEALDVLVLDDHFAALRADGEDLTLQFDTRAGAGGGPPPHAAAARPAAGTQRALAFASTVATFNQAACHPAIRVI